MLLLFLFVVSLCKFWPFWANFKQVWQRAGDFQSMKGLQGRASKRPQQKAVLETSPGQLCVANDWLQRWCPLSAPASPEALNHSFAALRHLDTIWEISCPLRHKQRFHAGCEGQTENARRCMCYLQKPAARSSWLLMWARAPPQWRWCKQGLKKAI